MMTCVFFVLAFMLSAVIGCVSPVVAAPGQGVSEDTIAARARFFGAENVDEVVAKCGPTASSSRG